MAAVNPINLVNGQVARMSETIVTYSCDQDRVRRAYKDKMKSRLFGLLREREKDGEWEKFLDTLLLELYSFDDSEKTINYYRLIEKMSKMKYVRFSYFRSLIFECMNLLDAMGDVK